MSESETRKTVKWLAASLDPRNVENSLSSETGTPDMNVVGAWMELKYRKDWPARKTTMVRLDHFTDQQRQWLLQRSKAGEECYLVLQVKNEWFIWNARGAQTVGFQTRQEMNESALAHWMNKPTPEQFVAVIRPTT